MANPHHRSKHKQYLHHKHTAQQHLHHREHEATASKTRSTIVLAVLGAIAGFIISWMANNGNVVLLTLATIAGAVAGYLFGSSIDRSVNTKK